MRLLGRRQRVQEDEQRRQLLLLVLEAHSQTMQTFNLILEQLYADLNEVRRALRLNGDGGEPDGDTDVGEACGAVELSGDQVGNGAGNREVTMPADIPAPFGFHKKGK